MSKPLHSPATYKQKSACGQKGTALQANRENTTEEKGFTYGLNVLPRPPQSLAAGGAKPTFLRPPYQLSVFKGTTFILKIQVIGR